MEKIFINGKIYTMDNSRNVYESMGITGNKIEVLGTNDEVLLTEKEETKIIDLKGKTLVPGFNDSHMHLVNYGYALTQVDLMGARAAALIESYSDDLGNSGITMINQNKLDELVELSSKNDTHVAIHGIGDRAMYMALESIEKSLINNPKKNHRNGIVHCQITDEILLNRFKELDVIAYIQPIFLDYDWKIVKDRVVL